MFILSAVVIEPVDNNGVYRYLHKNEIQFFFRQKFTKMSSPRTPNKPLTPKSGDTKPARASPAPAATPPTGSGQRRSGAGSQLGSPAVRSGVNSAASPSGTRDKLNSGANKQGVSSPVPSMLIISSTGSSLTHLHLFSSDQISDNTNRSG